MSVEAGIGGKSTNFTQTPLWRKTRMSELKRLREENKALREVLARYVAEDETYEGGEWEERNAHWLKIKREAQALLEPKPAAETPGRRTQHLPDRPWL
jgi:hypothetical protein